MKYSVNDNNVDIRVLIFKDLSAYNYGLPEVIDVGLIVSDSDSSTYFSESILDGEGKTSLTQAYIWLKTLPQYASLIEV
jgi:methyl coenzyme M reductase beta subunit